MVYSRLALSILLVALTACDESHLADPDAGTPSWSRQDAAAGSDAGSPPAQPDAGLADGGTTSPGDAAIPDPDAGPPPEPPPECPEVTEGLNIIHLGDTERRFWVNSPASAEATPSAVFWFHGYSGPTDPHTDALNNSALLDDIGIHPDADPSFPFVRVLLEDTNLQPLAGLDWDIRTDEPNRDLALFDVVVQCVMAHRGVPQDRIFAAGFSAGATIANLLHSARPEVVRAIYTGSGLWVNEPLNRQLAQRVTLGLPLVNWDWPALPPVEPGLAAILLTHGGPGDNVPGSPNPIPSNLTEAGRAAVGMLVDGGRLVIECEHNGGHTLHPEVTGQVVLDFFAAHVGTGPSPWMTSAPPLPSSCTLHVP